jgi:hypothetical protein
VSVVGEHSLFSATNIVPNSDTSVAAKPKSASKCKLDDCTKKTATYEQAESLALESQKPANKR